MSDLIQYAKKFVVSENNTDSDDVLTLVTKEYVASNFGDIHSRMIARCATTSALISNFTRGSISNGAVINIPAVGGVVLMIDGLTLRIGDTVLVKDQITTKENGVYMVKSNDTSGCLLQRSELMRFSRQLNFGLNVFVIGGDMNSKTVWYFDSTGPATMDISAITFVVFSRYNIGAEAGFGMTIDNDDRIAILLDTVSGLASSAQGVRLSSAFSNSVSGLETDVGSIVTKISELIVIDSANNNLVTGLNSSVVSMTTNMGYDVEDVNSSLVDVNGRLYAMNGVEGRMGDIDVLIQGALNSRENSVSNLQNGISALEMTRLGSVGQNLNKTGTLITLAPNLVLNSVSADVGADLMVNYNNTVGVVDFTHDCNVAVFGNLSVGGDTITGAQENLTATDKVINLNSNGTTNASANGGGIEMKGAGDKTLKYNSLTEEWKSNIGFVSPNINSIRNSFVSSVSNISTESGNRINSDQGLQNQIDNLKARDIVLQNDIESKLSKSGGVLSGALSIDGGLLTANSGSNFALQVNTLSPVNLYNSVPSDTVVMNVLSPNNNSSINPPVFAINRAGSSGSSYGSSALWVLDRYTQGTTHSSSRIRLQLTEGNNNTIREPIHFRADSIVLPLEVGNNVLILDNNRKITCSTTSQTQLNNLSTVTSNIQDQLDDKLSLSGGDITGTLGIVRSSVGKKLSLFDTTSNLHQYRGFAIQAGALEYHLDSTASDQVFYAGVNSTNSSELMRVKGTGSVIIPALAVSRIVVTGADKSLISGDVTNSELNCVSGASGNIQTQIDSTLKSGISNFQINNFVTNNTILKATSSTTGTWAPEYNYGFIGIFGPGTDGNIILATNMTLLRDMYYNTLFVPMGYTLFTNGFRVYCKTSIEVSGSIRNEGGFGGAGGIGAIEGTIGRGFNGGIGTTGAGSAGSIINGMCIGNIGGRGGSGASGPGGIPSASYGPVPWNGGQTVVCSLPNALTCRDLDGGKLCGGTGGGSGSGNNASGIGGNGGGGGGLIVLAAPLIILNASGEVSVAGGTGGSSANASNCGGGGGGGGGTVIFVASTVNRNISTTVNVTGGVGGISLAGGVAGLTGGNGYVRWVCNSVQ